MSVRIFVQKYMAEEEVKDLEYNTGDSKNPTLENKCHQTNNRGFLGHPQYQEGHIEK